MGEADGANDPLAENQPPTEFDAARIELLLGEARGGSSEALGQLFAACRQYLIKVANRELGEALRAKVGPSDLVQETSLEAHRDFTQFRGQRLDELLAWLRTILMHNLNSAARRYQVAQKRNLAREISLEAHQDVAEVLQDADPSPRSLLATVEEQQMIERAIERLPADQRRAVLMRHRDQLSFAEIGEALSRSTAAAHKLWTRAIVRLHRELSHDNQSERTE